MGMLYQVTSRPFFYSCNCTKHKIRSLCVTHKDLGVFVKCADWSETETSLGLPSVHPSQAFMAADLPDNRADDVS
jgi:hypothetical protein